MLSETEGSANCAQCVGEVQQDRDIERKTESKRERQIERHREQEQERYRKECHVCVLFALGVAI